METIIAALIGAAATIISTLITVRHARKAQPEPGVSPKQTLPPPSVSESPREPKAPIYNIPAAMPSWPPSLRVQFWLICTSLLMLWVVVSPAAIHGVFVGPNLVIIIPVATLLLSVIWPIWPGYAVLVTVFLHTINLIMSVFFRDVWEKDQAEGAAVSLGVAALNTLLVAGMNRYRVRRAPPSRYSRKPQ